MKVHISDNATTGRLILENAIREVNKDPYWQKCSRCIKKGMCCSNDCDVSFEPEEKAALFEFLSQANNRATLEIVVANANNPEYKYTGRCVFQTDDCCLIHEIRPLNCRYTPHLAFFNESRTEFTYPSPDAEHCIAYRTVSWPAENINIVQKKNFVLRVDDGNERKLCIDIMSINRQFPSPTLEPTSSLIPQLLKSAQTLP